jgi:hypothetical protein
MHELVVLLDVDNTLLDNDRVRSELEAAVAATVGAPRAARFWDLYEAVRDELDHVSFPVALDRFGRECDDPACLGGLSELLYQFPFADCLYPGAIEAVAQLRATALPAILSDGDQLFQRHKIRSAGLEQAVEGRVLVYVHKEDETADIRERYPARHYAVVDDKPRIHAALKARLGDAITTVQVCQGHYARDAASNEHPPADITIDTIADLAALSVAELSGGVRAGGS